MTFMNKKLRKLCIRIIIACFLQILITTSNLEILSIHIIPDLLHQMAITWKELLQKVGSCHVFMLE